VPFFLSVSYRKKEKMALSLSFVSLVVSLVAVSLVAVSLVAVSLVALLTPSVEHTMG
jgi:uncharacterized membrane protein YesL